MSDSTLFKKFESQISELVEKTSGQDMLQVIFNMQCDLMKRYGHDPTWLKNEIDVGSHAAFRDIRTKLLLDMVHAMDDEISEFRSELPWKHWKKYEKEDQWHSNYEKRMAAGFELIDILHFLMESFILLGFDAMDIYNLYLAKNTENFNRQDEGYDKNYKE